MKLRDFERITALAMRRSGSSAALEEKLKSTPSKAPSAIAKIPDQLILSAMTRRVFYAGFSSKVVDAKWDAFELAYHSFDPHACAFINDEEFDALMQNEKIVRNGVKVKSVQLNAKFVLGLAAEHGSAARFFANWPNSDYIGLLELLKLSGSRLGGDTGMRFLRDIGKPSFVLGPAVIAALLREKAIHRPPTGKRDMAQIQEAFNYWSSQSGRTLTEISRILASSVEDGGPHGAGH